MLGVAATGGLGGIPLIRGLIVTHGHLAEELRAAAARIEGEASGLDAITLEWDEPVESSQEKIAAAIEKLHGEQVIIFTDMFGGTPSNLSLSFFVPGRVEIITGVNLPMVVKFATLHETSEDLVELARVIREKGSGSIRVASDLLAQEVSKGETG